jgi:hypothetical protein
MAISLADKRTMEIRWDQPIAVMPGLGPGIHALRYRQIKKGVDGRTKSGHDE